MELVSVVIPTHSRTAMLHEAAQSVLNQTFPNLELLIVASAATPETIETAHHIASSDPRARVIIIDCDSLAAARNAGIEAARGDWVAFLDDDDLWFPTKIERQLSVDADMVNCNFVERGGELDGVIRSIRPPAGLNIAEGFVLSNYGAASASGAMVRTEAIRSLGGFDEKMNGCEDWDMWRRLSWNHRIVFIDEPLLVIRRHAGAMQAKGASWFHLTHIVKASLDTPPHLRHMVKMLWKQQLLACAKRAYLAIDRLTFGCSGSLYRLVRSSFN